MNIKKCTVFFLSLTLLNLYCAPIFAADNDKKIIIQITLDQFKADYLKWYRPAFSGGLKRVLENGTVISEGLVDHALTNSFPGHLSLSSGMYPAQHGFPANEWIIETEDGWGFSDGISDKTTWIAGDKERTSVSPNNILVPTIADWVKSNDNGAKAIALSSGTAISLAYGGKKADAIYWLDGATGQFVTSSYYAEHNPRWLDDFNAGELNDFKMNIWQNQIPIKYRSLAEPDRSEYENFGVNFTFPHNFEDEKGENLDMSDQEKLNRWFYDTPLADEALFAMAKATMINEELGQDDSVDYLAVIINSTDNVGHAYGGRSQEILDTLIRIDLALGSFLTFLDDTIGEDAYVIAISGDHGSPDVIEYQQQKFGQGRRISQAQIDELLDAVEAEASTTTKTGNELISSLEAIIESYDFVYDAITEQEIDGVKLSQNPYMEAFRRNWVKGRIPDFPLWGTGQRDHHPARYGIVVLFHENTIFHAAPVVHGSPYSYDRAVPIVFYGSGLGNIEKSARTIDVAPTLAAIAGIKFPTGLDGKVLLD
ncbi:MAG: hypothetical protein HOJ34_01515 [Kordiimonadaceae bacterium]|nr:hypothetical protein [Kordiimonadaceae bacterium]MBT6328435.1 hypothetical protein [Kordiimonadaceae bacterium]MBT7582181.1 hypothetical protein [Kordiimonadaceae bacterium]